MKEEEKKSQSVGIMVPEKKQTEKRMTEKRITETKNEAGLSAPNYAPALESTSCVSLEKSYSNFIGGKFVESCSGEYFPSVNPANEEVLAELSNSNKEDIDRAVSSAQKSFQKHWSKESPANRGRLLFRLARLIQERAREFAVLESLDNGKPIKESRDIDVPLAAAHFFYYAGWADKLEYAVASQKIAPLGVVGQIIPWNFPLLMAAWKLAPALATGNTVVLKPAESTSLTALLLAELVQEAGFPEGSVNVVTGFGDCGAALVKHPAVNKIAFTGSTEVGKMIAKEVASSSKALTLELGGKSAHIVFDDASIDQAVEGVINGIFINQGHVCCAGSRLLLQENIQEEFVEKLHRRMKMLQVGNPLDKNTDVGAINSKEQLEKIHELMESAQNEGGEIFQSTQTLPSQGFFFSPCTVNHLSSSATINRVEVFGPVLTINTFREEKEAVAKANNSPYGLAAGVWSNKAARIHSMAKELKAGVIWANTYNKFDPASPFGGYFESGYGREGGLHGLFPYLKNKFAKGEGSDA